MPPPAVTVSEDILKTSSSSSKLPPPAPFPDPEKVYPLSNLPCKTGLKIAFSWQDSLRRNRLATRAPTFKEYSVPSDAGIFEEVVDREATRAAKPELFTNKTVYDSVEPALLKENEDMPVGKSLSWGGFGPQPERRKNLIEEEIVLDEKGKRWYWDTNLHSSLSGTLRPWYKPTAPVDETLVFESMKFLDKVLFFVNLAKKKIW